MNTTTVHLKCPNCGSCWIHSNQLLPVTRYVGEWVRDENGEFVPTYTGESKEEFDCQTINSAKPFICTECGEESTKDQILKGISS